MDSLRDYHHRRLELGDMLRSALNIARGSQDEDIENQARSLLSRLAEDRFTLAVVGQFSRGKSTLMNAILGDAHLPTGVLPMTSAITTVQYGSTPRASYLRRGSTTRIEVGLPEIPSLVAQASGKRAELQVTHVNIELPSEILRLGVTFVDTPGIGSAIGVNSASTRQFLPEADAVLFVTAFDSALTTAELELLHDLSRQGTELFCVINKRDLVDDSAVEDVRAFVQQTLRESAGRAEPRLFAVSALEGLHAKLNLDQTRLIGSGIAELENNLEAFLTTQKSLLTLRNIAGRASNLIARQRRDLRVGQWETGAPSRTTTVAEEFEHAISELRARQHEVGTELRGRLEAELPHRLAARSQIWKDELRTTLTPPAEAIITGDPSQIPAEDYRERTQYKIQTLAAHLVQDWIARRCAEVTEMMTDIVADQVDTLIVSSRSPNLIGVKLAGMLLPEDTAARSGWSSADVPMTAVPHLNWTLSLDSGAWPRLRQRTREDEFRRRVRSALDHAVEEIEPQARDGFVGLIEPWTHDLLAEIERRTEHAAARFQHNLLTLPSPGDIAVLDRLLTRLHEFGHDLPQGQPGTRAGRAPAAERLSVHGTQAQKCVICAALTQTLFRYLSRRQFLLATREADQEDLARTNGFCALHTWAYHGLASPLGVSAGYARLADTVAQILDEAGTRAADSADLNRRLNTLVIGHEQCPVCQELAQADHRTIEGLLRRDYDSQDPPTLCINHLARVLEAGPSPERAREMVRHLAATLSRNAEDMRSYALKREALHRGLLTAEETRAHLETLRLLAGDPALARASVEDKELTFGGDQG
jgi:hypothetical protein